MRGSPVLYLASYGFSLLGKGIASVIMPLLVLDRTGDVLAAGVLATVATATSAGVGIVGGLLVDRVDRRLVSSTADLLGAAAVAALPVADSLWGLDMTWFVVMAVIGAVVRAPGMTAHETLLPAVARLRGGPKEVLDRLLATRETLSNLLLLAGPGLGGLFVALFGLTPALLYLTAALSLFAALLTRVIDPRAGAVAPVADTAGGAVRRAMSDLLDSWRFLTRSRIVLGATLISSVFVAAISAMQTTLMPAYFTRENLPSLAGLTLSAFAAGSILGSALYAASAGRVRRRIWFVIGMLGTLTGFAGIGSLASPWLVLGSAALIGFTNAPAGAVLGVLTIEATPDEMRGRVLGAQNALLLGAPALTSAPLAAVAAEAGLLTAGLILAAFTAATAIGALLAPVFRSLESPEPAELVRA
ncbi:MFS transporter [Amycolatopsis sp. YIM 10]|uniref:MFS transporter n=1 Tax=Amycolatopsis sp. YIM 10 TaxID=2653857 RepID=UPI00129067A0|nr:MFS transporter [Amycolatopsis sp. YIM 10]QFU88448.1 putative multidrug-efflux transporter [Amycolatopsis sp. YIM 10]